MYPIFSAKLRKNLSGGGKGALIYPTSEPFFYKHQIGITNYLYLSKESTRDQ